MDQIRSKTTQYGSISHSFFTKYQQITPLHTDSRRKTSFSWVLPIMNHRIAMNSTPLSWRNWRSLVLMACPMNQVWKFSFTWSLPIFLPRKRFSFDQFGSVWIEKPYDLDQNNNLIVRFRPNSWRVTLATMVAQLAWLKANAWKTVRSSLNRKTGFLKSESRRTSSPIQKQYDIFKSIWINFDQFQSYLTVFGLATIRLSGSSQVFGSEGPVFRLHSRICDRSHARCLHGRHQEDHDPMAGSKVQDFRVECLLTYQRCGLQVLKDQSTTRFRSKTKKPRKK